MRKHDWEFDGYARGGFSSTLKSFVCKTCGFQIQESMYSSRPSDIYDTPSSDSGGYLCENQIVRKVLDA